MMMIDLARQQADLWAGQSPTKFTHSKFG